MTPPASTEPMRRWRLLRPHAQRAGQFGVALALLLGWLVLLSAAAWVLDCWPVALFCVLVLAACIAGFWHAARHALDGETVAVHADGTVEVQIARGPSERSHRFNAAWLQVEHRPGGVRLSSHGRRVLVGTQVGTAARLALAMELRTALRASAWATQLDTGEATAPAPASAAA